jgi:hypothetical protein
LTLLVFIVTTAMCGCLRSMVQGIGHPLGSGSREYGRSGEFEQTPRVVRQECGTGAGAELEVVEAGDALARGPEGMVGSEENPMPLVWYDRALPPIHDY